MPTYPETVFPDHTPETAPPASRRALTATADRLGHLPAAVARMAGSPHLLDGFLTVSGLFEATTLDRVAREVVILTIATRNGCGVCVAMHTAVLAGAGADGALVEALRAQRPLADERLEAVRGFVLEVLAAGGAVGDDALRAFLAHGYTPRNALEVVLGIGAYTMSTLANRLTRAPLAEPLAPFAWHPDGRA
ncbi:carboxymuconolactone decarboxylase family protein [Actinosynnema sp. NPDC023587]|uniref:carboxymuconolactone decarboxylase family protein n=1 Tax=Actinosynnema sp. NPDC023587 TaxID=3154695 RepID=UPI0033DDD05F